MLEDDIDTLNLILVIGKIIGFTIECFESKYNKYHNDSKASEDKLLDFEYISIRLYGTISIIIRRRYSLN